MNQEKIVKILLDELCSTYCYNCEFQCLTEEEAEAKYQYWGCDDCHRKYMGWRLAEATAERIANRIMGE